MSLSRSQIKYIRSLELKKNRRAEGMFLAEGPKVVGELLGHFSCRLLAGTREWCRHVLPCLAEASLYGIREIVEISEEELSRASLLRSPQQVLALFEQPKDVPNLSAPRNEFCLALDDLQDPGNMGTIIRLADWFGIKHIYCSPSTVDAFSPKVIQATMGSIARVSVHYIALSELIAHLNQEVPVYGTFLDGDNIYEQELPGNGLLVMGNEGNGIGNDVAHLLNHHISIPAYPAGRADAPESLNVALATAIACAEWRRRVAWQ